jgi:hypothetical protein
MTQLRRPPQLLPLLLLALPLLLRLAVFSCCCQQL